MPEHIRAFIVVMALALSYFFVARRAVSKLLSNDSFQRWRNVWLATTAILFLSHSLWIFTIALGAILLVIRRREDHVLGLYFLLTFVALPAPAVIPGLGILDHIWVLDHYRLLGVTLLLPAALSLLARKDTVRLGSSPVDWMVVGYLLIQSTLAFRDGNITNGLRIVISTWVDIFLPYYVASRSLRSEQGFRYALTGYVMAAMILSLVAIFELGRGWKLYHSVLAPLGVNEHMFGHYLMRSGLLRPSASVGNSITLGYVLLVALGFCLYLKENLEKSVQRYGGLALIVIGIIASLSRGPWVGAALLGCVFVLTGSNPLRRLLTSVTIGTAGLMLMSQLPGGRILVDALPFIGTIEQGNVEYRANLVTAALPVIKRNLLFGSNAYLDEPELQVAIQGDGIIDVVNSYLGVILYSGVAGLAFFVGGFAIAALQIQKGRKMATRLGGNLVVLGRTLIATVISTVLVIYTVSSIGAIPVVYWSLIGLSAAYAALVRAETEKTRRGPSL